MEVLSQGPPDPIRILSPDFLSTEGIIHEVDQILAMPQSLLNSCCWQLDCTWSSGRGDCNIELGYH